MTEDLQLQIFIHSLGDRTRVPQGKCSPLTEQFVLPANALTERERVEFKSHHAQQTIDLFPRHVPNMTWDNVIGYAAITLYDVCKLPNMDMAPPTLGGEDYQRAWGVPCKEEGSNLKEAEDALYR